MVKNNRINQCTITLNRTCNLRCSFCYAKKTNYEINKQIDYNQLTKIIDFCNDLKVKYLVLTGGEPLLYPEVINVLEYIKNKKHKMIPTMASNGILLDDEKFCSDLISNGLKYIDISLKGSNEKEWVNITGINLLQRQKDAIKNLSKLPIEFTCSMVLCKSNIETFTETIKMARENGARQFSFTFVIDNDYTHENSIIYLEKNNPHDLVEKFISKINELDSISKDWWIEYSYPMCIYTEEQLKLLKNKLAAPCQIHTRSGITFDTDSNLIPCNMNLDLKIGQFGKDFNNYKEFKKYRKNGVYREITEKVRKVPSNDCKKCKYLKTCYGGCPILWRNYSYEDFRKFIG